MSDENLLDPISIDDGDPADISLSAQVEAAFDAAEKGNSADNPVEAPKDASPDNRPRQPDGKFAPKAASESTAPLAQRKLDPTPAPSGTATAATRKPPASWSADPSAWESLAPAIQDAFLKRDADASKGIEEQANRFKTLEERTRSYGEIEQVYAPYAQRWAQQGIAPAQAIKNLLNAQSFIERDPVNALLWLQQTTNVDPARLIAALSQPPAQRQQQAYATAAQQQHQQMVALQRRIDEIEVAPIRSEIETFRANPAHKHFDTLQPMMQMLIERGQAQDLQSAYDLALYANPQTRQEAVAEQAAAQAKTLAEQELERLKAANGLKTQQAAQAAKARSAAVTVRGAPRGAPTRVPGKSIQDDALAAYEAVHG